MNQSDSSKRILLLSANPKRTVKLRLDEEMREIKEGLKRARHRDRFGIESAEAVRYRDIHRAILDIEPNIIHFSGHGAGEEGLVFEDESGQSKLVEAEALAGLFKLFADSVECVILNACYSEVQAEAIARHIPYVIGMSQEIGDLAAIEFAIGFYDAVGAGKNYEFAYELGCNLIQIARIAEHLTPQLFIKGQSLISSKILSINEKNQRLSSSNTIPEQSQKQLFNKRGSELVINSSEKWLLLKDKFFQVENFRQYPNGLITVEILSEDARNDAIIQSLRPSNFGQSNWINFAYRNDGSLVKIVKIEAETRGSSYLWILTLEPANIQYGEHEFSYQGRNNSYSSTDIARLRGGRILLNDPPKLPNNRRFLTNDEAMLDSLISSVTNGFKVETCVFQFLYSLHKETYINSPTTFLEWSRLCAIFNLKAGGVVEQILELTLKPIEQTRVHVRFQGKRRKIFSNVEAALIEIEGDCSLEG